jgi:hypothetical protein
MAAISLERLEKIVVYSTLILGAAICLAAAAALAAPWWLSPTNVPLFEKFYGLAVVHTLQPVFTAIVASVLTFVLGHPVFVALAERIRARGGQGPAG